MMFNKNNILFFLTLFNMDTTSPSYALSNDDILRIMKGKVKVMRYQDVANYDNIDELLKPYGNVVILYESKAGYGHWVALCKRGKNMLSFFDSYGIVPDNELEFIPKAYRQASNQMKKHLTQLLADSKYKVEYNNHPFQSAQAGVSTCGRWACGYLLNKKLGVDGFWEKINEQCKKLGCSRDEYICQLIK